jgi:hypothetical protein
MNERNPPYLDWALDRWKLTLLLVLFIFLLIGVLWWPEGAVMIN